MQVLTQKDIDIQNQQSTNINTIENVYLLKQYGGVIDEIVSDNTIYVNNSIIGHVFTPGQRFVVPFDDIDPDQVYVLTNTYYQSSTNRTRLSFDPKPKIFDSSFIGKYIAMIYDVSDKLFDQTIKDIEITMETNELSEFDSGKLTIELSNKDGYFRNRSKNGLLDAGGVWWGVYKVKFKGGDTKLLYYSGIVELTDIVPDLYRKTIDLAIYGHSYELSRYAATDISNPDDPSMIKITGINLLGFTPSDASETGVKKVKYSPFSTSKLKGVQVEQVSMDTTNGIKVLEFRYPFYFRWDNGAWYKIALISDTDSDGSGGYDGKKTLYGNGGSGTTKYAVINFGNKNGLNEYPDSDTEDWVSVKDNSDPKATSKDISQQGMPTLTFDDGQEVPLKIHFQRILKKVGSVYTDISDKVNIPIESNNNLSTAILAANGDSIIIVAPERFWGIEFLMSTVFSPGGQFEISYSTGGNLFSAAINTAINGLSDSTINLSTNGIVRWQKMDNWLPNDIIIDTNNEYKGYMVKITRTAATGSCSLSEIKRTMRATGSNNDMLEFGFSQPLLNTEETDDEIVIRKDVNNNWTLGVWYSNITVKQLLELALTQANYPLDKRQLSSLKISRSEPIFNIWGKPPKNSYSKFPTAMYIDSVDADNYTIYCAIGIELWKCTNKGVWEKITTFGIYGAGIVGWTIDKIWKTGDFIYINYRDTNKELVEYVIGFGKYDLVNKVYTDIRILSFCHTGVDCLRDGGSKYVNWMGGTPFYVRDIGQSAFTASPQTLYFGENICIPFPQFIATETPYIASASDASLYPTSGNDGVPSAVCVEWYFDSYYTQSSDGVNSGPIYNSKIGFFILHRVRTGGIPNLGFRYSFGQQGSVMIDKVNSDIYTFRHRADSLNNDCWYLTSMKNDTHKVPYYYNRNGMPNCHVFDSNNGIAYLGFTQWHDDGQNTKSYSYISKCSINGGMAIAADKVIKQAGAVYTDVTVDANVPGSVIGGTTAVNQTWYLCSKSKFKAFKWVGLNTYVKSYWNGINWVPIPNSVPTGVAESNFFFSMPRDWAKINCPGGLDANQYYVVKIECTVFALPEQANWLHIVETILWDSQLESGKERYMPTWLSYDVGDQYIYGSMFNRETSGVVPFQWIPFALDLTTGSLLTATQGEDFTFDGSMLLKDFVVNTYDSFHYCMAEDRRYNEKSAYLIKMKVSGGSLKLYNCGIPVDSEWGSAIPLICNTIDGSIFGISRKSNLITNGDFINDKIWEYAKSFYARIEVAQFTDNQSIKDIIQEVCQMSRCQMKIKSNRFMMIKKRSEKDGSINLVWDTNMVQSNPTLSNWRHYYDAVKVNWKSYVSAKEGNKKFGFDGWNKTVLSIDNSLVQTPHMAFVVGDDLFNYFNNYRIEAAAIAVTNLIQLECMDGYNIIIPNKVVDIDPLTEFVITSIKLNQDKSLTVKGIEVLPTDNV